MPAHGSMSLTARELETLAWFTQGYTRVEVAVLMGVEPETVKVHLKTAYPKLGARTVAEAIWRARARLEIELPDITGGNE